MHEDFAPSSLGSGPFWENFLDVIRGKNEFIFEQRVRAFQHEILSTGCLTIKSPFNGDNAQATGSQYLRGDRIFYQFKDIENFWLVSQSIHLGFPLQYLVSGSKVFNCDTGLAANLNEELALKDAMKDVKFECESSDDSQGPLLLLGHPNFAHNLWNELSALDSWLESMPSIPPDLSMHCQFEPFGKIESIFPALSTLDVTRGTAVRPGLHRRLISRIGSTLITVKVRERIVSAMKLLAEERGQGHGTEFDGDGTTFWITIRPPVGGRGCLNQVDFLSALVLRLATEVPKVRFIFDGFSLPVDLSASSGFAQLENLYRDRIQIVKSIASEIIDRVKSQLSPELESSRMFMDISGADLAYAIMLGANADYYVSHAGSIQHKIGWLHDVPGYIHTCTAGLAPGAQRWVASKLENGQLPDFIEREFVEDQPANEGVATRNVDYKIVNINRAVEGVISHLIDRKIYEK